MSHDLQMKIEVPRFQLQFLVIFARERVNESRWFVRGREMRPTVIPGGFYRKANA